MRILSSALFFILFALIPLPVFGEDDARARMSDDAAFYANAPADKVTEHFVALIEAYNFMYVAWPKEDLNVDSFGTVMLSLIDAIKYLEKAKDRMSSLAVPSPNVNEILSQSAFGYCLTIDKAIAAHQTLLTSLREVDESALTPKGQSEFQFKLAQFMSDRKHAYMEALQLSGFAMALLWTAVPKEQQVGKIRWRISDDQRRDLRRKINSTFGPDLKKHREDVKRRANAYNPVLVGIDKLDSQLSGETYSQFLKSR